MKKLLIITLALFSSATFARTCYVDLVDSWSNYRYETFSGRTYNGVCREGLRECNRSRVQRRLDNARCVPRGYDRGPSYPGPRPTPRPTPRPRPIPGQQYSHLLGLSDYSLADYASRGAVGSCRVERGAMFSICDYYVKVNGYGYPQGTGCSDRDYTRRYGCDSYSDKENAGCMVRKAIMQGSCI